MAKKWSQMRYLVTGAAGFIGSKILSDLAFEGHEVMGLDNFNDYYDVELKRMRVECLLAPKNIKIVDIDLCNALEVDRIIETVKPHGVFHLAAQAGVRIPIEALEKYVNSNLIGYSNVLKSILIQKVSNFVYASSSSVYGDNQNFPYSESDYDIKQKSFYGVTKRTNELMAQALVPGSATKARGLRFFTVYGPWGRPDMAYFRLINSALSSTKFELFGDGSIERDFTFIDDISDSSIQLMHQLDKETSGHNDIVNIGGGSPVSMTKLINVIQTTLNAPINLVKKQSFLGDVTRTVASIDYLNKLITPKKFTHIERGILNTVNWANSPEIKPLLSKWVQSTQ